MIGKARVTTSENALTLVNYIKNLKSKSSSIVYKVEQTPVMGRSLWTADQLTTIGVPRDACYLGEAY
jgi:hypothetical protein